MVDESLGRKLTEQALDDAVFQMKVDHVLVHGASVMEDDWADRRLPPPLPRLLIAFAGRPKRVHRIGPVGTGSFPLVEGGKRETIEGDVPVLPSRQWFQGLCLHHLQGARNGGAEMVFAEGKP